MRSYFIIKLSLSHKANEAIQYLISIVSCFCYIEFTYELFPFLNSNKSNGLFSLHDYYNNNYSY